MLTTQRCLYKYEDLEGSAKALGIYDTAVDGYVRAVYTSQQDGIWKYCIGKCVLGRPGGGESRETYSAITFISSGLTAMQGGGALTAGSVVDDAARCAAIADVSLSCPIKPT
jgi:hypothetical protein